MGPETEDISTIPNYDSYRDKEAKILINDIEGLSYSSDHIIKRSQNNSFAYVRNFTPVSRKKTSGWFVPSVGQWVMFLQNLCNTKVEIKYIGDGRRPQICFEINRARPYLKKYGIAHDEDYCCYWTSNECTDIHAHMIVFSEQDDKVYSVNKATTRMRTRGITAF